MAVTARSQEVNCNNLGICWYLAGGNGCNESTSNDKVLLVGSKLQQLLRASQYILYANAVATPIERDFTGSLLVNIPQTERFRGSQVAKGVAGREFFI
jgi:hypothetical protein